MTSWLNNDVVQGIGRLTGLNSFLARWREATIDFGSLRQQAQPTPKQTGYTAAFKATIPITKTLNSLQRQVNFGTNQTIRLPLCLVVPTIKAYLQARCEL